MAAEFGDVYLDTRRQLRGVAESLIAGPQYRASGTVRLAVRPDGFTGVTLPVAVHGTELVWRGGGAALAGPVSLIVEAAGVDFGPPEGVYDTRDPLPPDTVLDLDVGATEWIHRSHYAGGHALKHVLPECHPVLWPEHFDVSATDGEVTYGVSAGDDDHRTPYAYVSPRAKPAGPFWNAPFGALYPLNPARTTWTRSRRGSQISSSAAEGNYTVTVDLDFSGLRALFINCTLKRSPEISNTQGLIDISAGIMGKNGIDVDIVRAVDHDIATGVWPDMREHGWATDDWPAIFDKVLAADVLVLAGPIWLGDNSSVMKKVHERLYGGSHLLNDAGQYLYYGRVGGCIITGNEDGVKHCAQNVLYTLQHIGYTIPPQADAGWIGEAGPGPSYLDPGSGGPENDFTNRNTTFMTWNLMHLARMLRAAGGVPAHGNIRSGWDAGCRYDFANPEYR